MYGKFNPKNQITYDLPRQIRTGKESLRDDITLEL